MGYGRICPHNNSATTPNQSGPGSNDNEGVLRVPQSIITETLPLDSLASFQDTHLEGSYPSAEAQSEYSTVPVD